MSSLRNRPRNQPRTPGLLLSDTGAFDQLEKLLFPVPVPKGAGKDEENQIKARFESMLVQAENLPDLTFRSVSFNSISEFLGQADTKSRFVQGIRQDGQLGTWARLLQVRAERPPEFFALLESLFLRKASFHLRW